MHQSTLSSSSVLETLLKTNRPPTDQERAIIQESMAPTDAKLKVVEAQISDTMAHIQALKAQIAETDIKLQRLREKEAAILETSADHRRVLSPFRNLPEDVLREICGACVEADMPVLSFHSTPLPYILAQISSGMRHIVLETPYIWASMNICTSGFPYYAKRLDIKAYSILASTASEWLERAGGLALTIVMQDPNYPYARLEDAALDPSNILFDTLLSYSPRWKRIQLKSSCLDVPSTLQIRIAALRAIDVPLLESISLRFHFGASVFRNSTLLAIPTLKQLTLDTYWDDFPTLDRVVVSDFTINWAILTSITVRASSYLYVSSIGAITRMLQQTKCLVFCDITVGPGSENVLGEINLPFLETLFVDDKIFGQTSSGGANILDLINAPRLAILKVHETFLKISLSHFLRRTPTIRELSLSHLNNEESLTDITDLLHHCPSLSVLSLRSRDQAWAKQPSNANRFLRAFVDNDGAGVTCPRLQYFEFTGIINFSLQTLRQFLQAKHPAIAPPNTLLPWKSVVIDMREINEAETYQQMLDLVAQHQATGLDIYAYVKEEGPKDSQSSRRSSVS